MNDDAEMVAAAGVPTVVVAAACSAGLVRGISHFATIAEVEAEVSKAVGVFAEVQWSAWVYVTPAPVVGGADPRGNGRQTVRDPHGGLTQEQDE